MQRFGGHRMERKPNQSLFGFLVWVVAFLLVSGCFVPASLFFSGMSTFFSEDLIAPTLGPFLCPENTVAEITSFESTIIEDGYVRPATSYEMHCKSPDNTIIKNLGGSYALIWSGIFVVVSFVLAAILSIVLTIIFLRILRKRDNHNNQTPPLVKIQ